MQYNTFINEFKEKYPYYKIVYVTKTGSTLFGTNTPTSDVDYRGIFIPALNDVLLKQDIPFYKRETSKEKNTSDDTDFELWSMYHFVNLLRKMETNSVDLLFSMFDETTTMEQDEYFVPYVKDNSIKFLSNNFKSFIGYSTGQIKKYQIKGNRYKELVSFNKSLTSLTFKENKLEDIWGTLKSLSNEYTYIKFIYANGPDRHNKEQVEYISVLGKLFHSDVSIEYFTSKTIALEASFGARTKATADTADKIDYKGLSHSLRIIREMNELIDTNMIIFPLAYSEEIKSVKIGNCDYVKVIQDIETYIDEIDIKLMNPTFPTEPNNKFIDDMLIYFVDRSF